MKLYEEIMTELLNIKCMRSGAPIHVREGVFVKDADGDIVGWGWFEWEENLRKFWFREDYTSLLPMGMYSTIIENIFEYRFELPII